MAQNSTIKKGQCINFGNCKKADTKEIIEVNLGDEFVCPECESSLIEVKQKDPPPVLLFIILGIIVLGGLGFGAYMFFSKPGIAASIVVISPENPTVKIDETVKLTAKTDPKDTDKKTKWVWTSSDESIAKVSDKGVVTGVKEGNATISVVAETNDKLSANQLVTVQPSEERPIPAESVSLNQTTLDLKENATATLTASVLPENTTDKSVTWSSSDEAIAKVDNNGTVTGIKTGTATITAKAVAGNNALATCAVTVKKETGTGLTEPHPTNGTVAVPGGRYTGDLKNGKPHGQGTITYSSRTLISSKDMKKRYAEAGDYVTGQFKEGEIISVKLYDKSGTIKDTVTP